MKKIIFAIALICSLQLAYAQKPDADMQKAVDKALAATQDAKKGAKPATWVKLAEAYWKAYTNPTANYTQGLDMNTVKMMGGEAPAAITDVELDGQPFQKWELSHVNLYFNQAGLLAVIELTKASVPGDILLEAAKAYNKAYELGGKAKDIAPKMKEIEDALAGDAYFAYYMGDMKKASNLYGQAAEVSTLAPSEAVNYEEMFYAAATSMAYGDYDKAEPLLKNCLDGGYYSKGNVYANLSDCALAKADTLAAKNYLAAGLTSFSDNPAILTGLINLYLQTNEDPAKIVDLLDGAKAAMPNNPSLYMVEGDIYTGIKDFDKAKAAYEKGLEIDANYDMCWYRLGELCIKRAAEIEVARDALPLKEWRKYDEMTLLVKQELINSLEPFENCYNVSQDSAVKAASADYLKTLNFQLRSEGDQYLEAYTKWNAVVKGEAE